MKKKHFLFILAGILTICAASFLLYMNFTSTNNSIKTFEDVKQLEDKEQGDCWTLADNKTVCYFGTTNISPNELSKVDGDINKKIENKKTKEAYIKGDIIALN